MRNTTLGRKWPSEGDHNSRSQSSKISKEVFRSWVSVTASRVSFLDTLHPVPHSSPGTGGPRVRGLLWVDVHATCDHGPPVTLPRSPLPRGVDPGPDTSYSLYTFFLFSTPPLNISSRETWQREGLNMLTTIQVQQCPCELLDCGQTVLNVTTNDPLGSFLLPSFQYISFCKVQGIRGKTSSRRFKVF